MTRATAEQLALRYQNSPIFCRSNHGGRGIIPAYEQILSFLWFAGNKSCIRDVSERFNIGTSTFFRQQNRILDFLIDLAPVVINFPREAEKKEQSAEKIRQISGFPNIIGCLDGTYITVKTPTHKLKNTYVNRHDIPSVILQGICDSEKRFIDVFTGTPGKIHDSRVFRLSTISREISQICGERYHLLGDSAYPLREYLLTPYIDYGNLTEEQKKINKALSATRVLIENAFGLLKGRWRQLLQLEFHEVDKITKFIIACCVLHNLCIENADIWDEPHEEGPANELESHHDAEHEMRALGELKREQICRIINE
nr:unnamed protein product [Callosobruchus analis]